MFYSTILLGVVVLCAHWALLDALTFPGGIKSSYGTDYLQESKNVCFRKGDQVNSELPCPTNIFLDWIDESVNPKLFAYKKEIAVQFKIIRKDDNPANYFPLSFFPSLFICREGARQCTPLSHLNADFTKAIEGGEAVQAGEFQQDFNATSSSVIITIRFTPMNEEIITVLGVASYIKENEIFYHSIRLIRAILPSRMLPYKVSALECISSNMRAIGISNAEALRNANGR